MAIDINVLNSQLQAIAGNANLDQVLDLKGAVEGQVAAKTQTALTKVGEAASGILPLSASTDNPNATVGDADNCIVEITGDVPGLAADLIGEVPSADDTSLQAITGGGSVDQGSLKLTIGSGSPEAIAKALTAVTGKPASEVQDVLKDVAPAGVEDAIAKLDDAVAGGLGAATGLADAQAAFKSNFDNLLGNVKGGLVTNLLRKLDKTTDTILDGIFDKIDLDLNVNIGGIDIGLDGIEIPQINVPGLDGLREFNKDTIIELLERGKRAEAIQLISENSNLPPEEIEAEVEKVNIEPPSAISSPAPAAVGSRTNECHVIGSNNSTWQGSSTPINSGQFTYIDSPDELLAELRATSRPITQFVAHWAGTYTNQNLGADEIHQWHLDRGWSGIGYHYVIRRDGRLQRGRPLDRNGAHSGAYGHNRRSIGITFMAGYNCPSGTPNPNRYISSDSINAQQMATFKMFCQAFYDVWPGGQALGHYHTTDKGKVDPGFDVLEYVRVNFNKVNILTNYRSGPLTPEQISQG